MARVINESAPLRPTQSSLSTLTNANGANIFPKVYNQGVIIGIIGIIAIIRLAQPHNVASRSNLYIEYCLTYFYFVP